MFGIAIHKIEIYLVLFQCISANTTQIIYNVLYQIKTEHNFDEELLSFAFAFLNTSLSIFNIFKIDPNLLKMFVLSYSMWGGEVQFIIPFLPIGMLLQLCSITKESRQGYSLRVHSLGYTQELFRVILFVNHGLICY